MSFLVIRKPGGVKGHLLRAGTAAPAQRRRTALDETGHAVASYLLDKRIVSISFTETVSNWKG